MIHTFIFILICRIFMGCQRAAELLSDLECVILLGVRY